MFADRTALLSIAAAFATFGCTPADDKFEPNNSFGTSTPLSVSAGVTAVAVQENPDYFHVDVPKPGKLSFAVRGVRSDGYRVTTIVFDPSQKEIDLVDPVGPKGVAPPSAATRVVSDERATISITIPESAPGRYWLRVMESPAADNIFPFAWDYKVSAGFTP